MNFAVLDTNVIVSAGVGLSGPPSKLVLDWVLRGKIKIVTSPWVVGEYWEVVRREKFRRYGFPPNWLEFLIEESLRVEDPAPWEPDLPDPKDAPFLALARQAGAVLVTGNLKHFPKPARAGVQVLSPADHLAELIKRTARL